MEIMNAFGYLSTKNLYVVQIVNSVVSPYNTFLFNHVSDLPKNISNLTIDTLDMETVDNSDFIDFLNNSISGNHKFELSQYFAKKRLVYIQITTK